MSKQCTLIDPGEGTSAQAQSSQTCASTNWDLCALCQDVSPEKLVNPQEGSYRAVAECILEFQRLNCLPFNIDINKLSEGDSIEASFIKHKAKWHKTCRNRFDNQKLQRAQKRKLKEDSAVGPSPVKTRKSVGSLAKTDNCFFCDKDDTQEPLHSARTDKVDSRVREYAHVLQDRKLLGKLSEGDMHALDAKYHSKCLTSLSNRVRKFKTEGTKVSQKSKAESLILGELVSYIEEHRQDDAMPVFKLSDLGRLYESRVREEDPEFIGKVNNTRLKERLLHFIPDLRAQTQGREIILMFDADIGEAIKIAYSQNNDEDAIHLMRTAHILRKDILEKEYSFDGSFKAGCEKDVVPDRVLALIRMILNGPNIESQKGTSDVSSKVALSLSQLLMFNVKKSTKKGSTSKIRHEKARETPLAIYTGLMIHSKTRQRGLIDKLFSRGLCISYERIHEIKSALADSVCMQYDRDGCVCPSRLKSDLFTVGAVDNIDHNPSARNAMESFHGTAISVIQFPTSENKGNDRDTIAINSESDNRNPSCKLPAEYTQVNPVALPQSDCFAQASEGELKADVSALPPARDRESSWLSAMAELISEKEQLDGGDFVSWSAYHANRQMGDARPKSPIYLMPLFTEPAHSAAMVSHAMKETAKAIQHLHPGQIPVITMDQPLYSIAKQIQWNWPDSFGEDKFVVVMGGLHIEMNVMKLLGDILTGSGWTTILVQSDVTTSGRADAILKGSHVTRSRYVHQVTAAALHLLQVSAFQKYTELLGQEDQQIDFKTWSSNKRSEIPQFKYWDLVLELELLAMQLVRSFRESNFELYVQCLGQLVPWMFAFDHTNYARWLPVHIKDMVQLKEKAPQVYEEFSKGHFAVQKSTHVFSAMAMDQAHEQMNELIKGEGGVIGITDNPSALIKWITAGPEIARIVDEFENPPEAKSVLHHDQEPAIQAQFASHVKAVVTAFEESGNPFSEDSQDLVVLDSKEVMCEKAVNSLKEVEAIGQSQYEKYVDERLKQRSIPISNIIPKNNVSLFKKTSQTKRTRTGHEIKSLKNNCELFSRMYISCQSRDGDMDEFFRHENQGTPPALSDMGELRHGTKSDLMGCVESLVTVPQKDMPEVDAKILDGSVVVNMLAPKASSTFGEYAADVFMPYLINHLQTSARLDVVWDRYIEGSLKSSTREKRGSGSRIIVKSTTPTPKNWQSFLRVDENKTELYNFLSDCISVEQTPGKTLNCTKGTDVHSTSDSEIGVDIAPCNHEEADTRLILHALHCAKHGHRKILIRTVDTDVVVLSIAMFGALDIDELWIAFGVKKHYRYIAIHTIVNRLGREKSRALPFFHALTGCDTTSSFSSVGKKTAWDTWNAFPEITDTFVSLSNMPLSLTDENMNDLQRFVILLYDRTSQCTQIDQCRKSLFAKGRQLDHIPPTEAALKEHVKRAIYQAGYCWGQTLVTHQQLPSPGEWGWVKGPDNHWDPFWTSLPEAAKVCKELIKCGCKKACRRPCKCVSVSLPCTELCNCSGTCYQ